MKKILSIGIPVICTAIGTAIVLTHKKELKESINKARKVGEEKLNNFYSKACKYAEEYDMYEDEPIGI